MFEGMKSDITHQQGVLFEGVMWSEALTPQNSQLMPSLKLILKREDNKMCKNVMQLQESWYS